MRAIDLLLAVPSNKFADVRWHWLWFHTQSCPYDRVRPVVDGDRRQQSGWSIRSFKVARGGDTQSIIGGVGANRMRFGGDLGWLRSVGI